MKLTKNQIELLNQLTDSEWVSVFDAKPAINSNTVYALSRRKMLEIKWNDDKMYIRKLKP